MEGKDTEGGEGGSMPIQNTDLAQVKIWSMIFTQSYKGAGAAFIEKPH